jgi:Ala-tRNA(Pro) deacylase
MRIADFLAEHRVAFESLLHPPAFTAQKRAKYLHVPGRRVAKSVLLSGPRGFFLAVLPATHQVDTPRLADDAGGPVRVATERELAAVFPDCEWGVVPPFGSLYGLPTVLDEELGPDTVIVFEGDSHAHAVRLLCRDFERLERPRRLRFARRPAGASPGGDPLRA